MRPLLICFFLLFGLAIFGQNDSITIKFIPTFNGENLVLDKNYSLSFDSAKITKLKFYVSNFSFIKADSVSYPLQTKGYLMNIENKLEVKLPINSSFDSIRFCIGIDSSTNSGGALGNDLDPINGMYWAWQSGYINFKLEGTSPACYARKSKFQFHIGGYLPPFNSIKKITLKAQNLKLIQIEIPINELLTEEIVNSDHTIMSPSKKAVSFSQKIKQIIKVKK